MLQPLQPLSFQPHFLSFFLVTIPLFPLPPTTPNQSITPSIPLSSRHNNSLEFMRGVRDLRDGVDHLLQRRHGGILEGSLLRRRDDMLQRITEAVGAVGDARLDGVVVDVAMQRVADIHELMPRKHDDFRVSDEMFRSVVFVHALKESLNRVTQCAVQRNHLSRVKPQNLFVVGREKETAADTVADTASALRVLDNDAIADDGMFLDEGVQLINSRLRRRIRRRGRRESERGVRFPVVFCVEMMDSGI